MNKVLKFPPGFLWGTATSAYQVEGGNKNDWWAWAYKKTPVFILKMEKKVSKAGKACDHYNRYEEDFDLAKSLNQNAHRFSIEWSRIEPEEGKFNLEELNHYRSVIQALKKRNIIPFVTLHHFSNPIWFHKKGSWLNKNSSDYFKRYVEFVMKNLKEEVNFWITINEPLFYAFWSPVLEKAYLRSKWPNPLDMFRAIKNLIQAHKKAYEVIHKFGSKDVKIGITSFYTYNEPYQNKLINRGLAWIGDYFLNKYFLNRIKAHQDFLGLDYYHHYLIKFDLFRLASIFNMSADKELSDMGWGIYPKGIYHVLKELQKYQKPVYILENGLADARDEKRAKFIADHLYWIHKAIEEGGDIRGYFHWSLIDNFEWDKGFWPKFGLIEIDYKTLKRKPRPSAFYYAEICKNNQLIFNS